MPEGDRGAGRPLLGPLEEAVLVALWDSGTPLTVREVHLAVTTDRTLAYTTVMTVLRRLTDKGLLTQRRDERAFSYEPVDSRAELVAGHMLQLLAAFGPQVRTSALARFATKIGADDAGTLSTALRGRPVAASAS